MIIDDIVTTMYREDGSPATPFNTSVPLTLDLERAIEPDEYLDVPQYIVTMTGMDSVAYRDMVGETFGIFLAESSYGTLMINYTIDGASITLCVTLHN